MIERFTVQARRVVILAQDEARMLNHNYIGTEHLLIALIRYHEGVAHEALDLFGIRIDAVRRQVRNICGQGQQAPSGQIAFTPRAKTVLEFSLREALQLGRDNIGTEHIMLGLIREREGVAAQVLATLGVDLNEVRQEVMGLLADQDDGPMSAGVRSSGLSDILSRIDALESRLSAVERRVGFGPRISDVIEQFRRLVRQQRTEPARDRARPST